MNRATSKFQSSIRGTLGAGIAAIAGNSGRTYCILQHQTDSQRYRLGQQQEIIVDYAEIGRGPKCVIRFGEDMRMVSAVHAALLKERDQWFIVNKSKTNQTLVNGRPVNDRWFLKTGDVIQLASDGPKLGFIVPQNSLVSSIGFTRRMELFGQQALRPYKRALIGLSMVFLIVVAALSYVIAETRSQLQITNEEIKNARIINEQKAEENRLRMDSMMEVNTELRSRMESLVRSIPARINLPSAVEAGEGDNNGNTVNPGIDLTTIHGSIFFIRGVKLNIRWREAQEEIQFPVTGTGFLLNDGRFVTAKHVIMPWNYISDPEEEELMTALNIVVSNGGTVTASFIAVSSKGQRIEFRSDQFRIDRSTDEILEFEHDGERLNFTRSSDSDDWAVIQLQSQGQLTINPNISATLPVNQSLYILGFPLGFGASEEGITPQQTKVSTMQAGLNNGMIHVSGAIDHGNSGGPALLVDNQGNVHVIGIVVALAGQSIRFLLPISTLR